MALDKVGGEAAEAVLARAVREAVNGDMRAAELILSRCWPARKGRPVLVALPEVKRLADLPAALNAVLAAVASGELSPEEAQAIGVVMDAVRRSIETADLERRLHALEERVGHEVD